MDRTERIYGLHRLLREARYPLSCRRLMEALECSRATLMRTLRELRDYLGAPVTYDREANGYRYDPAGEHPFELPGLWLNAGEIYALLAADHLLAGVQPGLLAPWLAPLRQRLETLLADRHLGSGELPRRVRILSLAARPADSRHFGTIAEALLRRRRLRLRYHGRGCDTETQRTVSPQRLVHYRDNWYLDAWCHLREGLRTFALERIRQTQPTDEPALDLDDATLDAWLTTAYGIFAGPPTAEAVLRFTHERARWVAEERWHPHQRGRFLDDGRYELTLPYGDPRELILDILRHGPDVEVVSPPDLRVEVRARLQAALELYQDSGSPPETPPVLREETETPKTGREKP